MTKWRWSNSWQKKTSGMHEACLQSKTCIIHSRMKSLCFRAKLLHVLHSLKKRGENGANQSLSPRKRPLCSYDCNDVVCRLLSLLVLPKVIMLVQSSFWELLIALIISDILYKSIYKSHEKRMVWSVLSIVNFVLLYWLTKTRLGNFSQKIWRSLIVIDSLII